MEDKSILIDPSLEKQLKGHKGAITALYFNPNEQQVASSSLDNSILLWDLRSTLRSYRFSGHDEAVMDVTFSPTGKFMASASRDKTVRLWVPTVTGSTGMFKAHSQTVRSVQFSSDALKLITASDDKIVKLWSSEKYKFITSFVGHTNWVRCARMSNDGSVIASCSDDKSTILWNPESGQMIHKYQEKKGHGLYLAWHPSGCYIAVGTSNGNIKLYDIRTHSLVQYYSIHNDAITQLAFHPSGSYILTSSKDGKMKILDLLEGHPIFTLSGHTGSVNAVAFSPSGETFASAGEDKLCFIWKTNFTELGNEKKENTAQNTPSVSNLSTKPTCSSRTRTQGMRKWYLCYHSNKYPVANFVQLNDNQEPRRSITPRSNFRWKPNLESIHSGLAVNSSLIGSYSKTEGSGLSELNTLTSKHGGTCSPDCDSDCSLKIIDYSSSTPRSLRTCRRSSWRHSMRESTPRPDRDLNYSSIGHVRNLTNSNISACTNTTCNRSTSPTPACSPDCPSNDVGHSSHIPRSCPPKPSTYTIPTLIDEREADLTLENDNSNLFGIVRLKPNDVCYTSGTIEWVGRKRSYPINTGFKTMNDFPGNEPMHKVKRLDVSAMDKSFNCVEKLPDRDCECTEMLPTVNAIVDHLNALHEAVDLIDLRLTTIEDNVIS